MEKMVRMDAFRKTLLEKPVSEGDDGSDRAECSVRLHASGAAARGAPRH
jgi:hypothetical protein